MRGTAEWTVPTAAWGGQRPSALPIVDLPVLVGVHHKTGTKWMLEIFKGVAASLKKEGVERKIHFAPHSKFSDDLLSNDFRGLHLIRDPRDVVLSGLHYHKKADEKALHVPQPRFCGLTYQQKLNSFPTEDEQFLFELRNRARLTVDGMRAWCYDDPRFFEARYETLVEDTEARTFSQILMFLGLSEAVVRRGAAIFKKATLFPGKPIPVGHTHIRSGRPEQWRTDFRRWHGERFVETMGDCLLTLGYERNNDWVTQLPE